jgi:two-component system response regulator YesN
MTIPRPHILVVDDDPAVLEAVEAALLREYRVSLARDIRTASAILKREPVHLVILDVRLGQENGLEFLTYLREKSDVPVLLISAYGTKDMLQASLRARASDFLDKPFPLPQLLDTVRALLAEPPPRRHIADRIRRLLEQRYMLPWTVRSLAKELRLSARQMRRVFYRRYGQHVMKLLTQIRMERAGDLVATTDLPFHEVSAEVGIADPRYFRELFKRHFGMSPRAFREAHRRDG